MGPTLVLVGLVGFIVSVIMSKASFERNNSAAASAGRSPQPGTGDVPSWISGLYLLSLGMAILGAILWLLG